MTEQDLKQNTFAIYTLGCKVNQEEGVALANVFNENNWQQVDFKEVAQVYIINTCTVTHLADKKSKQIIRRAIKQNPEALVVATGCFAQTNAQELALLEGIDLIVGTNDRPKLFGLVQSALREDKPKTSQPLVAVSDLGSIKEFVDIGNLNSTTGKTRAFIKIEDGCNQFCTYCIIPYARGPVRSKMPSLVLQEAKSLIEAGYKELVLTGIHIGAYGTDFTVNIQLADLVKDLLALPGLNRLRLGSIEPLEVTKPLLELMQTNTKLCTHLHIPLQAGNNKILQAMNRHYTVEFYEQLLKKIRLLIPNIAITTDVITGFPGETSQDFYAGLEQIKQFNFSNIHIFPYSKRQGTPAADFPMQVEIKEKQVRAKALAEVSQLCRLAYWQQQVGKTTQILLEQPQTDLGQKVMLGHNPSYLPLAIDCSTSKSLTQKYDQGQLKGELLQVKITDIAQDYLWCTKN